MLQFQDLGSCSYQQAWDLQKELQVRRIKNEIDDTVLLVEHEPVYTFGKNANEDHLLQNYPDEVNVFRIERGGDITYHGPGQLVGYPIMDLHNYKMSISWYMRALEKVVMLTLEHFGIASEQKEGLTGVWVRDQKIAALGVGLSRWVTMHGFALNVNTDLHYYGGIIPCGIFEYGVTSMAQLLRQAPMMADVKKIMTQQFKLVFTQRVN